MYHLQFGLALIDQSVISYKKNFVFRWKKESTVFIYWNIILQNGKDAFSSIFI